MPILQVQGV